MFYYFIYDGGVRKVFFFFFSSRRRHTRLQGDWSSDVCSSDLGWLEWDFDCRFSFQPLRDWKSLGSKEIGIEQLGLIARAVVAKHGDDGMAGAKLLGEPNCTGHIDARGAAEAKAFVLQQVENHRHRLLVGDLIRDVDWHAFEILCDAALTDPLGDRGAFGFQSPGRVVAVERRPFGVGETNFDVLVALLQRQGDASERSTSAYRANETVDLAVSLLPDLLARRSEVPVTIGDVVELIGPDGAVLFSAREFSREPAGDLHIVV